MAEGILAKLPNIEIAGLPISDAAYGAAVAGLGDVLTGVIQGFAPQVPSAAVKLGSAFALGLKPVKNMLGSRITGVAQLLLVYDAIQETLNIRGRVSGMVGGIVPRGLPRRMAAPIFGGIAPSETDIPARSGYRGI
ncbi:MAG: hypothetical protein Q8R31_05910 [Candidatus Omnitrophota bacterium]|nr:hypothetical protein [Candidatus Omnitrophota bacterium]